MVDLATPLERLLPDRADTTIEEQLAGFDPVALAQSPDRPYVFTNFALTVDGHATVDGRSGAIGTETDTAMLVGLRMRADAIMIGAGTMRAERYGRLFTDPARRAVRERRGLPADPLFVLVSGRLDLPWDAPLFTDGGGRVLIFTSSEESPPETATPIRVVRHPGRVNFVEALRYLRVERGIRSLLSEGGPHLHADLLSAGLVDELFVTLGPMLAGGDGPGLTSGLPAHLTPLELAWLLRGGDELFARYRIPS